MTGRNGVALVSVMHDPDGRLMRAMRGWLPTLLAHHAAAYVVVSESTTDSAAAELATLGVRVEREPRPGVGAARRQAMRAAVRDGHSYFHYCDLDRALHWASSYPDELAATMRRIGDCDLLVIGRTDRAFAWHPNCMVKTEQLANHVFALAFGREWDLCAAARGLSAQAAALVLDRSKVNGVGTEGEWPALALRAGDLRCDYVEVEGMEYETPDRFPDEVAAAGGVATWTAAESLSSENWTRRIAFAWAIADGCLRPGQPGKEDVF